MKYLIVLMLTSSLVIFSYGQDKIVTIDNTIVEGKVLRVDSINVEVNPIGDNPFIIIPRADIKLIIYKDNTVVSFEKESNYNPYLEEMRLRMEAAEYFLKELGLENVGVEDENEEERELQQETGKIRKEQESERIRWAEEERIRQEQAAEQRRIEEERRRQEEQASRINNRGKDYWDDRGFGNGPIYGLGTRKAVGQIPMPNADNCNVTSRIVVEVVIHVDRNGNVVGASVKSATFADNCIWNTVLEAARKTKFTSDQNAAFKQTGWINYTIEP